MVCPHPLSRRLLPRFWVKIAGLSATNIVRLKRFWEDEFLQWEKRDLKAKEYACIWVDGIYFNVRLDDQRSCILVIMGADRDGKKELLAVSDGYRESSQSWREILLQLKAQGLTTAPKLAIGDGVLGFWNALDEIFSRNKKQRCWVHKTANVLRALLKLFFRLKFLSQDHHISIQGKQLANSPMLRYWEPGDYILTPKRFRITL